MSLKSEKMTKTLTCRSITTHLKRKNVDCSVKAIQRVLNYGRDLKSKLLPSHCWKEQTDNLRPALPQRALQMVEVKAKGPVLANTVTQSSWPSFAFSWRWGSAWTTVEFSSRATRFCANVCTHIRGYQTQKILTTCLISIEPACFFWQRVALIEMERSLTRDTLDSFVHQNLRVAYCHLCSMGPSFLCGTL